MHFVEVDLWEFLSENGFHLLGHIFVLLGTLFERFSGQDPMLLVFSDSEVHAAKNNNIRLIIGGNDIIRDPWGVSEELELEVSIGGPFLLSEVNMESIGVSEGSSFVVVDLA